MDPIHLTSSLSRHTQPPNRRTPNLCVTQSYNLNLPTELNVKTGSFVLFEKRFVKKQIHVSMCFFGRQLVS